MLWFEIRQYNEISMSFAISSVYFLVFFLSRNHQLRKRVNPAIDPRSGQPGCRVDLVFVLRVTFDLSRAVEFTITRG